MEKSPKARLLVVEMPSLLEELAARLLKEILNRRLEEFRNLKEELSRSLELKRESEAKYRQNSERISFIEKRLVELEPQKNFASILVFIFLIIFVISLASNNAGFIILSLLLLIISGTVALAKNDEFSRLQREKEELQRENRGLESQIEFLSRKIATLEGELKGFRLPPVLLRAFRAYAPVSLARVDGGFVAFAPWADEAKFELFIVSNPDLVNEAIKRLRVGENIYLEATIREKDTGYKVVKGLRELNFWEKVLKSRNPEIILDEVISEVSNTVSASIEYSEETFRPIKPAPNTLEFFGKLFSDGIARELDVEALGGRLPVGGAEAIEDAGKFRELCSVIESMQYIPDFTREALEFTERQEIYTTLIGKAIKELIEATIPLEGRAIEYMYSRYFCRKCASTSLRRYKRDIDLRRWVLDYILGGVDRDPDILFPHESTRHIVEEKWRSLNDELTRSLPLPNVKGSESLDELLKNYEEGLEIFALPLTGSDEQITLKWVSVFSEPEITCGSCGSVLGAGDYYKLFNLELPAVKGYIALLNERVEHLEKVSSEIIRSVNEARNLKNVSKTGIGAYEQILRDFEKERESIQKEIAQAESHLKMLREYSAVVVAGAAALNIEDLVKERPELKSQVERVLSIVRGEGR
ncbi:hypothetical protein IG193_00380 [Infirmifilum lucidum]|uniref:Uncharacterized protein n=1 Tax=Infirmifilum lucidum TaxID=2776706 RepID=A0A7L9FGK7_9CREN|nr:hypothetical protein [Infirmifilum lucidum]QOJ78958.1 hypothetical protein IG193_00380 [Infirmifilum lucidum]